jgi:hypothetical protein
MLKLTTPDRASVYISPAHISAICQYSSGNTDVRFAGGSYLVRETPEQIMAMPEMIRYLNAHLGVPLSINGNSTTGWTLSDPALVAG